MLAIVLFGQHLGRRHERALVSALHGDEERADGDHGLARADVTLQEPVHRVPLGQVDHDLADRTMLRPGEVVGKALAEAVDEMARATARTHGVRDPDRGPLELLLAPHELELHPQQLVEHQATAGVGGGAHRVGSVDVGEGDGPIDQVESSAQRRVERVGEVAGPPQHLLEEAGHVPAHDPGLLALRVDGHDPRRLVADEVHHRVRHLPLPLVLLDPPEEDHVAALLQLSLPERLVEERHPEVPGPVGHVGGDQGPAVAGPTTGRAQHRDEDGGLLPQPELGETGLVGPVDVATGVVGQQLENRVHAHLGEGRRAGLAHALQLGDRQVGELGEAPGHRGPTRSRRGTGRAADPRGAPRPRGRPGCRAPRPRCDG